MVEVTCEQCKTLHRFQDADVPPAGKLVKCTKCMKPLSVAPKRAASAPPAIPPARPTAARRAASPPTTPGTPGKLTGGPSLAAFDLPPAGGDVGDVIDLGGGPLDIADLPAPKRASALSTVMSAAKPAPKSALDGFVAGDPLDIVDLPTPVAGPRGGAVAPHAVDLDVVDLPAPVGPSRGRVPGDLPAPVGPLPTRRPNASAGSAPPGSGDARTRRPAPSNEIDLPTPVGSRGGGGGLDLPAQVSAADIDLLMPVGPVGTKAGAPDLPAPKGFFDDVPAPVGPVGTKGGGIDLLAPKGFFDDVPAPKGPVGAGLPDLPAPKGFFEDLPGPSRGGGTDLPAPKGFFEDLPGPRTGAAAASASPSPSGGGAKSPARPAASPPYQPSLTAIASPPSSEGALDLDDLDLAPPRGVTGNMAASPQLTGTFASMSAPSGAGGAGRAPAGAGRAPAAEPDMLDLGGGPSGLLDLGPRADGPRLELPESGGGRGLSFKSSAGGGGGAAGAAAGAAGAAMIHAPKRSGDEGLELAVDEKSGKGKGKDSLASAAAAKKAAARDAKEAAKSARKQRSARTQKIVLAAVLVVAAAGAGGYYFYERWQTEQEHKAQLGRMLIDARKQLDDGAPGHWAKAAAAAEKVLHNGDAKNAEALGIAGQGYYAGLLDDGLDGAQRLEKGKLVTQQIDKASVRGPAIDKAQALKSLIDGQPLRAIERLQKIAKSRDGGADAQLFLAWAYEAAHDPAQAAVAFTEAGKDPDRKLASLYGLGRAQLALGKREEARATFAAIIKLDPNHIGAQVGAVQAEVAGLGEREKAYLAILNRKDIDKTDPRVRARAFVLAGEEALKAHRGDVARERFDKALAIFPDAIDARVGQAKALVLERQLDAAAQKLKDVLLEQPAHTEASLTLVEVQAAQGDAAAARATLATVEGRPTPLQDPAEQAHLAMVQGQLAELDPAQEATALAAYQAAAKLVGTEDIAPTIAWARLLSKQAKAKDALKDSKGAEALRLQAKALLGPVESQAKADPTLAVMLGVTYLAAGDAVVAEQWFRGAIAAKPSDAESKLQLGLALRAQGKTDDAIAALKEAMALDEAREEIALQLGVVYEDLARDQDAIAVYRTLLEGRSPSINARARAGRFYARAGQMPLAAEQAKAILAERADHPAGKYLQGEVAYAAQHYEEAARNFQLAVDGDANAQYLDALGRAHEQLGKGGDTAQKDQALAAYERAGALSSQYLNALLGQARLHLERHANDKALAVLTSALALRPGDPSILLGIGDSYFGQRKYPQAVQYLTQAAGAANVTKAQRAEAFHSIGLAYHELENLRGEAQALTTAADLAAEDAPWLTATLYMLGDAQWRLNNANGAKRAWKRYLARGPSNAVEVEAVRRRLLQYR